MEKRDLYEFNAGEWIEFNEYLRDHEIHLAFSERTIEDLENPGKVTAYYFRLDLSEGKTLLFPYPETRLEGATKNFLKVEKLKI